MRLAQAAVFLLCAAALHAHEGWGVVVDQRFGVVVTDIPGNTIWRIRDGRLAPLIREVHSHELVLGGDGALYGSDPKPNGTSASVWRHDAAGALTYVIPPTHDSPLGLQSFLITEDRSIYSARRYDQRNPKVVLLRRLRRGEIEQIPGDFTAIDGMKAAPDGRMLFVDGTYLRSLTPDGRVASVAGPLTRQRWGEDLLGLSSIRDSIVHVADHAGRRVLRVDTRSGLATVADRSSFFWAPAGVEIDGGTLYVLEHLRPPLSLLGDLQIGPYLRVRKVGKGTLAVIWGRKSWHAAVVAAVAGLATVALWRRAKRRRLPS